jgi:hypothetical protein
MGRDAGVAGADHRMLATEPTDRSAAAAWMAFVAWLVGVVEIRTTRALKQVARRRRPVAQLSRRTGEQCPREQAVVAPHTWVGGKIGVAHQRADAQAAFLRRRDLVERQAVHVNQMCRRFDLELRQVEQVGAAGDEPGALDARGRFCCLGG